MRLKKLCALLLAVALTLGLCSCGLSKEEKYDKAVADVKTGKYDRAIEAFESLKGYEDSEKYIMYARCLKTGDSGDYDTAIKSLTSMGDFKEAAMYIKYYTALAYEADESYEKAAAVYDEILLFKDVQTRVAALPDKILDRDLAEAERKIEEDDYDGWYELYKLVDKKYTSSETRMYENIMNYAAQWRKQGNYEPAVVAYELMVDRGYREAESALWETAYDYANALMSNGQYDDAYAIYLRISEYKNVSEILKTDKNLLLVKFKAGNSITLGNYPQTKAGNDNTPIEWLVLESDRETALLISRYALDCRPYNEKYEDTTWEQCTLRGWLNNEFFNKAFSTEEKQYILQSNVSADKNPKYSTNPGNATKDNVFLLSIVEANKYFKSDDARMCAPTDYAIQQGAYTSDDFKREGRKACWWWLRSPGYSSGNAANTSTDGSITGYGLVVDLSNYAVRPCVRVRLF